MFDFIGARYQVCSGPSGQPVWHHRSFRNLDDAIARADAGGPFYVRSLEDGWSVVYMSRAYQKKYPLGGGGGGVAGGGVEPYWMQDPFEAVEW